MRAGKEREDLAGLTDHFDRASKRSSRWGGVTPDPPRQSGMLGLEVVATFAG